MVSARAAPADTHPHLECEVCNWLGVLDHFFYGHGHCFMRLTECQAVRGEGNGNRWP